MQTLAIDVHSEHAHVGAIAEPDHPQWLRVRREPNDGESQGERSRVGVFAYGRNEPAFANAVQVLMLGEVIQDHPNNAFSDAASSAGP